MKIIYDILGAIGIVFILLAYFLLQRRKLTDDDHSYNILNALGALAIIIYSSYYKAWFSVVLNVVWFFIALFDLIGNLRRSSKVPDSDKT
jgi:hypothetical protein